MFWPKDIYVFIKRYISPLRGGYKSKRATVCSTTALLLEVVPLGLEPRTP